MPRLKMTDKSIKAIKPPATGRREYWDADPKGFGLRVSETGGKTWIFRFRFDGCYERMTLGRYPTMPLAEARKKARLYLADVTVLWCQ